VIIFLGVAAYRMRMALTESQKRELEKSIANKTSRLEEKNRELEAFSDSVSHDLRTPLWQIREYSDLLINDPQLNRSARDMAERIKKISSSSSALIDDLLQFSKFEKEEMRVVSVDMSALANDVAAALRAQDPERNVKIDIAEDMTAEGDPRMVRVLLHNLLSNAWKYTGRQECPVIECGQQDSGIKPFYVKDNGVGFDMGQASELFTPFKRLHSDKDFSGTGIGLSLAQRIVHRHGGRIWARSEKSAGATFFFTLPADSGEAE
jgi:light-regulated signal transduction histidine kinase (bacteriophytochrome)